MRRLALRSALSAKLRDGELVVLEGFALPAVKTREMAATFPDTASVAYLRGLGVKTVLVLRRPNALNLLPQPPPGTQVPPNAVSAPVADLSVTREIRPDVIIFRL